MYFAASSTKESNIYCCFFYEKFHYILLLLLRKSPIYIAATSTKESQYTRILLLRLRKSPIYIFLLLLRKISILILLLLLRKISRYCCFFYEKFQYIATSSTKKSNILRLRLLLGLKMDQVKDFVYIFFINFLLQNPFARTGSRRDPANQTA